MSPDPYRRLLADLDWVAEDVALRDTLATWAALPRRGHELVGSLHRPGPRQLRGSLRLSARIAAVNARWFTRMPSVAGRRSVRDSALAYLADAAANAGPGGRSIVALFAGHHSDAAPPTPKPPQPMPVAQFRAQLGPAMRRLAEIDDVPATVSDYDQVHRARLDDGRTVAVVATRPGTARDIRDTASVVAPWLVMAELADRSPWRHGLVEVLRDLVASGHRRCDQRAVALDAAILHAALGRSSVTDVAVARPVAGLVDRASAVYEVPEPADLGSTPRRSILATGMSSIVETGLVHGVYTTHFDPGFVWNDAAGGSLLVGGTTLGSLRDRSRDAIASLLQGEDPVDALVALDTTPPFVDRDAAGSVLERGGIGNPLSLVRPDVSERLREAAREMMLRHGTRPTPELTSFGLALARLIAAVRAGDGDADPATLALHALPRLAGIGARMTAA